MSYRVLIVDDNKNNSKLIEGILHADVNKYDCLFAEDGLIGYEVAKREFPDVILMDYRMPNATGLDCLKMLQRNENLRDIPVIFITAYKTTENFTEAFAEGAFDFITKPIDINELKTRLNKALSIGETLKRVRKTIDKYEKERIEFAQNAIITKDDQNAFIILSPEGELEWANDGFKNLHGVTLEEFKETKGKYLTDLNTDKVVNKLMNSCINDKLPINFISKIERTDGSFRWLQTYVSPQINPMGFIDGLIAVESDITSLKLKEEELNNQNKKMLAITKNLENANHLLENQKFEIEEQKRLIEEEQEKSERLLLNILPFEVARQLKSKGKAGTRFYRHVTVMFTDFKDFSSISKDMEPKDIVDILDKFFAKFDEITGNHYLEKIKTIGDAYMCAGGLPLRNNSNPVDAVLAGLEIQHFIKKIAEESNTEDFPAWKLRLGIHTGAVVAGVVGSKKFAYDIWGSTVNIASRMENMSEINMVNVSGTTYEFIKDYFQCEYRGNFEAKNVGMIDMYYVFRINPEYAEDEDGLIPNEEFKRLLNKL